jgi:hypothetical protein
MHGVGGQQQQVEQQQQQKLKGVVVVAASVRLVEKEEGIRGQAEAGREDTQEGKGRHRQRGEGTQR